jgi:DNA-binding transcriptional MerR regulator
VARKPDKHRNGRPIEGKYTLDELRELTGVSPRTLGKYTTQGLLPRPVGGGRRSRYGEVHLLLLLAIAKLHDEGIREIDGLRARLDAMNDEELDAYTRDGDGGEEDEPDTQPNAGPSDDDTTVALPSIAPHLRSAADAVRYTRHELVPGLELHLREDATDETRHLAEALLALARPRR